jgi:hypothetical protein
MYKQMEKLCLNILFPLQKLKIARQHFADKAIFSRLSPSNLPVMPIS